MPKQSEEYFMRRVAQPFLKVYGFGPPILLGV